MKESTEKRKGESDGSTLIGKKTHENKGGGHIAIFNQTSTDHKRWPWRSGTMGVITWKTGGGSGSGKVEGALHQKERLVKKRCETGTLGPNVRGGGGGGGGRP